MYAMRSKRPNETRREGSGTYRADQRRRHMNASISLKTRGRRSTASAGSGEWERGYFCAVAALIRMNDGLADTTAIDLFKAGGKPDNADECDKTLFREAGLLPNDQGDGRRDGCPNSPPTSSAFHAASC